MRTSTTVTCPSCHASWHARGARFCGDCGAGLRPRPAPEPAAVRPWLRPAMGFALTAAAVVGASAVGGGTFRLPQRATDPVVELADGELTLEGEPLSDAERAEALAPFDTDRLRCEPEGCERWRVDFAAGPSVGRASTTVVDDLVVAAFRGEVFGYDLASGEERWRTAWPDATDAPPASSDYVVIDDVDGDVVVVGWLPTGHVLALDLRGRVLWHGREGVRGYIEAVDEVVVAAQPSLAEIAVDGGEGGGQVFLKLDDLRVLDPHTGGLLWEAEAVVVQARPTGGVVLHDGTTARLHDVRTGALLAERPMAPVPWLQPAGDVLVYAGPDSEDGAWQLLSARDLTAVAELGPLDLLQPTVDGSVLVGQVRGDATTGDRVLLYDLDGTLRWEHELPLPAGSIATCCAGAVVEDDDLVLPPPPGGTAPLRFDLSDGTRGPPPPGMTGSSPAPDADEVGWWVSPRTALTRDAQDADGSILVWHDGHRMAVRGRFSGPHTTEPPLVFTGSGSLLAVQPVPRD